VTYLAYLFSDISKRRYLKPGNTTISTRVATARRQNGHRQVTQTGTEIWAKGEEKHRAPEEKMEGPTSP
jgi:hypothetical protein